MAVNDAFLKATSRKREELVGISLFAAFPASPNDHDDTGVVALQRSLGRVIATGQPEAMPLQRYPIRLKSEDGQERFEERYWNAVNIPVFGPDGKLVCISHHTSDVTEQVNAEKGMRESEMRYRKLFDSIDQGFCIVDVLFDQQDHAVDYRFCEINPKFEKLTGIQNATGKSMRALAPEHEEHWFAIYGEVAKTGKPIHFENEAKALNRWFDVHAFKVDEPNARRIAILFTDITEQRSSKYELSQRVIKLETADRLHSFQIALADRTRMLANVEEVTAAAGELLGQYLNAKRVIYGEADESGKYLTLNRDWTDGTLSSMAGICLTLNDFGPLIADAVRQGRVLTVEDVTTNTYAAPYANSYLANGVRSVLGIPLMKKGQLKALLSVHDSVARTWTDEDIALAEEMISRTWLTVESARTQAELRTERDRIQSVLTGMKEGFMLLDANWRVLQINAEALRISLRTEEEVIGKNHWKVWPESLGTPGEKMYLSVMETRAPGIVEYLQPMSNGGATWLELRAYPTSGGEIAVFFRDITARKRSEEKLKEADRRKDEFLAMLAHELRNPLAPIGAAAELLQLAKLDETRIKQTSQIIGRQVDHMTHLIDDLLDVSRVTRGLVKLDTAPVDIRHIVSEAIEQVTPLIQARHHHFTLQMQPDTAIVMADKKRLVQVLTNLLNNSAKYTNQGGNITLKTETRNSHVLIEIIDDGIGMTTELVTHAFDLFAQGERSSDRSAGGLGLGLALVKSLLGLHHGTISCESEGIGKGSKFTVCLPRYVENVCRDRHLSPDSLLEPSVRSLKIMVVDDNKDAATMLAMLLEASGHEVSVTYSSEQALELARSEVPEVCVLDIGLPEMDGNELAQRIRAQAETAKSVLIAVTGYGQENDREHALAAGFDHHFVKPVDTKRLASVLADISKI